MFSPVVAPESWLKTHCHHRATPWDTSMSLQLPGKKRHWQAGSRVRQIQLLRGLLLDWLQRTTESFCGFLLVRSSHCNILHHVTPTSNLWSDKTGMRLDLLSFLLTSITGRKGYNFIWYYFHCNFMLNSFIVSCLSKASSKTEGEELIRYLCLDSKWNSYIGNLQIVHFHLSKSHLKH